MVIPVHPLTAAMSHQGQGSSDQAAMKQGIGKLCAAALQMRIMQTHTGQRLAHLDCKGFQQRHLPCRQILLSALPALDQR